jgi:lysophospholipase L1-like esterase
MSSVPRPSRGVVVLIASLALSACGQTTPSAPPASEAASGSPSQGEGALHLVVIGDSIPFAGFCEGCLAFVQRYADTLESTTGRVVDASNRSRNDSAQLDDIKAQVADDAQLRDELAIADIVIISIGFNNGPPWPADRPCGGSAGDTVEEQIATVLAYDQACIGPTVASYAADYDAIYGGIAELVPQKAVLLTLNVYNNWIGYPDLGQSATAEEIGRLESLTRRIFDAWNEMLCERATTHGFSCVDVYHAFNGVDGLEPPGAKVGDDYTHPSQAGNDVIADLLAQVEIPAPSN